MNYIQHKSTVNPLVSVFDVFVPEGTFNDALNLFISESQTKKEYTLFEYNNMKLIKKIGASDCNDRRRNS